jgi:hypothetical protein
MPVFAACFDENVSSYWKSSNQLGILQGEKRLAAEAESQVKGASDLLVTFTLDVRSDESVQKARELVESKLVGYKGNPSRNSMDLNRFQVFGDWSTMQGLEI